MRSSRSTSLLERITAGSGLTTAFSPSRSPTRDMIYPSSTRQQSRRACRSEQLTAPPSPRTRRGLCCRATLGVRGAHVSPVLSRVASGVTSASCQARRSTPFCSMSQPIGRAASATAMTRSTMQLRPGHGRTRRPRRRSTRLSLSVSCLATPTVENGPTPPRSRSP